MWPQAVVGNQRVKDKLDNYYIYKKYGNSKYE
jgi:hypothetical protein